jgi:membrane protease YdiL (CAAX protease family)
MSLSPSKQRPPEAPLSIEPTTPHRADRLAFVKRRPVLTYYVLTFAISWGGFLLVGGRGLFASTSWQADPLFLPAVLVMIAGPSVAGLLLTGLVGGRAGYRELLASLLRWRAGWRWYAVALLTGPLVAAAVPFALSVASPVLLPALVAAENKTAVLLAGIGVGLSTLLEELGWTGFATPRLRLHRSVSTTGLVMGVLWGVWHSLTTVWVASTSSGGVPPVLFLTLYFLSAVASLTAYRVLMIWVYDRTESLLMAWLMHASYAACTIFIFATPVSGASFLTYAWVFTAALWLVVVVVAVANNGHLARQPLRART